MSHYVQYTHKGMTHSLLCINNILMAETYWLNVECNTFKFAKYNNSKFLPKGQCFLYSQEMVDCYL